MCTHFLCLTATTLHKEFSCENVHVSSSIVSFVDHSCRPSVLVAAFHCTRYAASRKAGSPLPSHTTVLWELCQNIQWIYMRTLPIEWHLSILWSMKSDMLLDNNSWKLQSNERGEHQLGLICGIQDVLHVITYGMKRWWFCCCCWCYYVVNSIYTVTIFTTAIITSYIYY